MLKEPTKRPYFGRPHYPNLYIFFKAPYISFFRHDEILNRAEDYCGGLLQDRQSTVTQSYSHTIHA